MGVSGPANGVRYLAELCVGVGEAPGPSGEVGCAGEEVLLLTVAGAVRDNQVVEAVVRVTGKEPGTFMDIKGKSCTYGVTLIKDAPNRAGALLFLEYLLDPQGGLKILEEMGQPPFIPCRVPDNQMRDRLDKPLQALVEVRR